MVYIANICLMVCFCSNNNLSYFSRQQKITTMTADEYFEKHPELKQKFEDEIRNDNWGY